MRLLTIKKSISIRADALEVFDVITDFAHYGRWNPWVIEAHGECRQGSTVRAVRQWLGIKFAGLHEITEVSFPEKMRWRGNSFYNYLVQVERERHVFPGADGVTLYTVKVTFSGPLAHLGFLVGRRGINAGVKAETMALKQYCEQQSSSQNKNNAWPKRIRSVDMSGAHEVNLLSV
jgi:hypothetical protein